MKVFISWSGSKSRAVAEALKGWLPDVLQQLEVWMSAHDIEAGSRWNSELDQILENCNFGIMCLTPENLDTPWLLFEAGSLAKAAKVSKVIPYRIGLTASNVKYPLAQFQGVDADKEGTLKLIESINESSGQIHFSENVRRIFDKWWPDLESKLNRLPQSTNSQLLQRSERELLEEILEILRSTTRTDELIESGTTEFKIGDFVEHPDFGLGIVIAKSGTGDLLKLRVSFRDAGIKLLAVKYADLRKVDP